jgi:hypothetical protein
MTGFFGGISVEFQDLSSYFSVKCVLALVNKFAFSKYSRFWSLIGLFLLRVRC